MPKVRAQYHLGPHGECSKCGQRHVRRLGSNELITCAGHRRWTTVNGERVQIPPEERPPCLQPARRGLTVCRYHGGNAPNAIKAGLARWSDERAEMYLRRFGQPVDTTPTEALLDTVKWAAGYVAWLREKVADADSDAELTQHSSVTGKREPSAWLDLLGTWHDKLVRACEAAIRAGIEERRVRIAEQQGALVADVIRKVLDALELNPDQQGKAAEVVPLELRRLAG